MEYLTDIDEFQAALKMVNVNEDMNVMKSNNALLEGVELDCYHKCQKILDTPEMKKCHKRCLDVNFDELNESDIDTINELYDLGIERGLIDADPEAEPQDNPEDNQMVDPSVQEPLKDVGDGCEMDDVDGDAYWDMKKALRECGEYGSIDKTVEEEIMDEEYPTDDDDYIDVSVEDKPNTKIADKGQIPPDEQIPEDEDPTMSEDPQSDEMTPPDGYDEDELIAALDDNDVAPSDADLEKMAKDNPPVDDKDLPFESEGDDTEADTEETPVADDSSTEDAGDEVQDTSTDDTESTTDDGEDNAEDDAETDPEEDSTDDTETDNTTDTETPSDDTTADTDDSSEDTSTEDSDTEEVKDDTEEEEDDTSDDETEDSEDDEKDEDSTEDDTEEDKPEENDLTADDKAQLKNEYTNMFSDIVKGMLSEVEPEEGKKAELCVKDMTPEQKSEFWNKVAEQWEGKADPADFMSASELESLEKQVEKKEKEESSKED